MAGPSVIDTSNLRRSRKQRADGIESPDIRVGEEWAAARDLGDPDRKASPRVGVVDGLLEGIVEEHGVASGEVAAKKNRVRVHREEKKDEERAREKALERPTPTGKLRAHAQGPALAFTRELF